MRMWSSDGGEGWASQERLGGCWIACPSRRIRNQERNRATMDGLGKSNTMIHTMEERRDIDSNVARLLAGLLFVIWVSQTY
jgi:hypothetical protein